MRRTPKPPSTRAPEIGSLELRGTLKRVMDDLFAAPLARPEALRGEVIAYLEKVRKHARRAEFLDVSLAEALGRASLGLLDGLGPDEPEPRRRLAYAAVRYFLLEEDTESDLGSPVGFDDDAEVMNAVVGYLGRPDLLCPLP